MMSFKFLKKISKNFPSFLLEEVQKKLFFFYTHIRRISSIIFEFPLIKKQNTTQIIKSFCNIQITRKKHIFFTDYSKNPTNYTVSEIQIAECFNTIISQFINYHKMTSLIGFLSREGESYLNKKLQSDSKKKIKVILCYFGLNIIEENNIISFFLPKLTFEKYLKGNIFSKRVEFLASLSCEQSSFCAKLSMIDQIGDQIKVTSQHQKVMLVRAFSEINFEIIPYQFTINPYTGKICLEFFSFFSSFSSIHILVKKIIEFFTTQGLKYYAKITTLLQYQKVETINQDAAQKLSLFKSLFKQNQQSFLSLKSKIEELHNSFCKISSKGSRQIIGTELREIKKLKQKYLDQLQKSLFENSQQNQRFNFSIQKGRLQKQYIESALQEQAKNGTTLFHIEKKSKQVITEQIFIQFENHQKQKQKKKLLKKLSTIQYFNFIHMYIQPEPLPKSKCSEIDSNILYRIYEKEMTLENFLVQNSLTMGLETKLYLIIQLLAIGKNVAKLNISDFNPEFGINNFSIIPNLKLKIHQIIRSNSENQEKQGKMKYLQREIFTVIYFILFKKPLKLSLLKKAYQFNLKERNIYGNLDDDESKLYGPSSLIKMAKILCYGNYQKQDQSLMIEDCLFSFIYLWNTYQKITSFEMLSSFRMDEQIQL